MRTMHHDTLARVRAAERLARLDRHRRQDEDRLHRAFADAAQAMTEDEHAARVFLAAHKEAL